MKNKYIYIVLIIVLLVASCETLDLDPEDWYGSESFWKNESQIENYITGLHADLRNTHMSLYLLGEARGGTQKNGTSFLGTSLDYSSPIKTNQFTESLTGITNWNGLYSKILNINTFITKVEDEDMDFLNTSSKNYYLGQAYGLRAFYYFLLYRTFGGVPIIKYPSVLDGVTDAESLYKERNSAKETMDFIKIDLASSEEYFGDNLEIKMDKGQWSKYATLMLKAEVYLWSAKVTTDDQSPLNTDIETAKSALTQIINSFELLPNFKDVFDYENKGNEEVIFAIRFLDGESTNNMANFVYWNDLFSSQYYSKEGVLMDDTLNIQAGGNLRHEYKVGLFSSMDNLDTRRDATFLDCYDKQGNILGLVLRKFTGMINSSGNRSFSDDYVVYRYAEVLLLMAEVENFLNGDPAKYINIVRERAYAKNYNEQSHSYENSSYEENELAILKERDKEFVWEGKRWFDLVRLQDNNKKPLAFSTKANYDDNSAVLKPSEAYKLLWPIDKETLNKDPKLVNNPGYE